MGRLMKDKKSLRSKSGEIDCVNNDEVRMKHFHSNIIRPKSEDQNVCKLYTTNYDVYEIYVRL